MQLFFARALRAVALAGGLLRGHAGTALADPVPAPGPAPPPPGWRCPTATPGTPCSSHGECEHAGGICWCDVGWGGPDCSAETPLLLEVTSVGPPELQDMRGLYRADSFFLQAWTKDMETKFMFYDQNAMGWVLSKFNSSCVDDMCAFAYAPDSRGHPPENGYVFGGDSMNIYHKKMVWDMADMDTSVRRGYFQGISYTHDPQILYGTALPDLSEYNGKYVLQPRYTHVDNGKYALFPVDLKDEGAEGKKYVMAALNGEPRKWNVLATAFDTSHRRYFPPLEGWSPELFTIQMACNNHVMDETCASVETTCMMGTLDSQWVRKCCRSACSSCQLSRYACDLPHSNSYLAALATGKRMRKVSLAPRRFLSPGNPFAPDAIARRGILGV